MFLVIYQHYHHNEIFSIWSSWSNYVTCISLLSNLEYNPATCLEKCHLTFLILTCDYFDCPSLLHQLASFIGKQFYQKFNSEFDPLWELHWKLFYLVASKSTLLKPLINLYHSTHYHFCQCIYFYILSFLWFI